MALSSVSDLIQPIPDPPEPVDWFGWIRSGWRPAVGWVCVAGYALQFVVGPLIQWWAALHGQTVPPYGAGDQLFVLLGALLGLGGLRTFEKTRGIS